MPTPQATSRHHTMHPTESVSVCFSVVSEGFSSRFSLCLWACSFRDGTLVSSRDWWWSVAWKSAFLGLKATGRHLFVHGGSVCMKTVRLPFLPTLQTKEPTVVAVSVIASFYPHSPERTVTAAPVLSAVGGVWRGWPGGGRRHTNS